MFPYGLPGRLLVLPFLIVCALHAHAADLPPGFAERQIASGLTRLERTIMREKSGFDTLPTGCINGFRQGSYWTSHWSYYWSYII